MNIAEKIKEKYIKLRPELDERSRRIWAATEALSLGHGGIAIVHQATGIARSTISIGKKELSQEESSLEKGRLRKIGAGRKPITFRYPEIAKEIEKIADHNSIGNPENPLRWTTKSLRKITDVLKEKGINIGREKVRKLLIESGFSLQATRKRFEGTTHIDRNGQFEYINTKVSEFLNTGSPVVSVDAKKKELVGLFSNQGREYHKKGTPQEVNAYDFLSFAEGKATPYGVYDLHKNNAWVSVGITKDTAQFAVSTLRTWWFEMGKSQYSKSNKLLINADGGGSNGSRNRLWKSELQKFANETSLEITVCHFPPGTSKWNKIEHRLFSQISKNWRGRPLETYQIIVNLIASTTTKTGLKVNASLDSNTYQTGIKISKQEMDSINIFRHKFHGEDWNYTIKPQ
ncbi:MAG: ISAzo13 family transposase [Salibacteraceae bacterium]